MVDAQIDRVCVCAVFAQHSGESQQYKFIADEVFNKNDLRWWYALLVEVVAEVEKVPAELLCAHKA
jgi:hypothetical protein